MSQSKAIHDFKFMGSFFELRGQHLELPPEFGGSFQLLLQLEPQFRVLHFEVLDSLGLGLNQFFNLEISQELIMSQSYFS